MVCPTQPSRKTFHAKLLPSDRAKQVGQNTIKTQVNLLNNFIFRYTYSYTYFNAYPQTRQHCYVHRTNTFNMVTVVATTNLDVNTFSAR